MKKLDRHWITEGSIDFEYKKYVLLAYLSHVQGQFAGQRLFPELPELQEHHLESQTLVQNKRNLSRYFPKNLTCFDAGAGKAVYESVYDEPDLLVEVEDIAAYSVSRFGALLKEGSERVQEVEAQLIIEPVGIVPLNIQEGYLLISPTEGQDTTVFSYSVKLFGHNQQWIMQTQLVDSFRSGIAYTPGNIKVDLIKKYHQKPNPATYSVRSRVNYPLFETLLPVAKQLMVRTLSFTWPNQPVG